MKALFADPVTEIQEALLPDRGVPRQLRLQFSRVATFKNEIAH